MDIVYLMNAASPVSARRTGFSPVDGNLRVFKGVRAIVEIQKPENLFLDPRIEVSIAADRCSMAYRRGVPSFGLTQFVTA